MQSLPHPIPDDLAELIARRFRAIGEPMRVRILDLLRDGELSVNSLAEQLGAGQQNVSKHLSVLAETAIVAGARKATTSTTASSTKASSNSANRSAVRSSPSSRPSPPCSTAPPPDPEETEMTKNMSTLDRKLRTFLVAPLLVVVALLVGAGSLVGIVLLVLAGVMLATSSVSFCPLYAALHLNTRGSEPNPLAH